MRPRVPIYNQDNVSSGILSPLKVVPLSEWKNIAVWSPSPSVSGFREVQPVRLASAVFLNEMVNRDIITGRYLKQTSVCQIRENKPNLQLTRPGR